MMCKRRRKGTPVAFALYLWALGCVAAGKGGMQERRGRNKRMSSCMNEQTGGGPEFLRLIVRLFGVHSSFPSLTLLLDSLFVSPFAVPWMSII